MSVARALTIAGSDSGGGAGIQADLKTFQMLDVFGMSAITAITVQNTLGVHGIHHIPIDIIVGQIEAVVTDLGVDAVKTGMLAQVPVIEVAAHQLQKHRLTQVVVDPVMVAKGGARLLDVDAENALIKHLLPLAAVVTPNIPEAEVLIKSPISGLEDMKEACRKIHSFGPRAVIVKGGHLAGAAIDVLFDGTDFIELPSKRIDTRHTHGTGCTFSAAITACLAKGDTLSAAVFTAKSFITAAITDVLELGQGHGPTNHWAYAKNAKQGKH
ncbi:MAG: thiD [Bacilli bacterium]|nr:thiD [Bacilli bacterium]